MTDSAPAAVFLSYAREDTAAARRIADALRGFGVEVWLDQSELRGGDAWDQKIRRQIKDCALFVAVISAHTESRGEGYFRLEWKLAEERTHLMAKGVRFLLPVVIDATADGDAMVPDGFRMVQWTRLPGGEPTPEFVAQVKHLLEAPRKFAAAKRAEAAAPQAAAAKSGLPGWATAALGALVLGLLAYIALRPARKESSADAPAGPVVELKATAPLANDKSLAVLPFENLSPDNENEFFSSGIREEILANLQTVRALHVIQYRGAQKNVRRIGEELKVAYALECSVRRAGTRVRVTAKLTNARTEEQVWVRNFERDLSDVFIIQSELAQAIAGELSVVISPVEKTAIERRPTTSVAAYDLYLKARDIRIRAVKTQAATDRTETLLRSAVELDPQFALAWGELAFTHGFRYSSGQDRTEARLGQARSALATLQRLAPDDPETVRQQGNYFYFVQRDYRRSTELFQRLILLRPNDPESYYSLCQVQRREGKWIECLDNFKKAIALDPQNDRLLRNASVVLDFVRHYGEALALEQRRADLDPGNVDAQFHIAALHFRSRGSTAEGDLALRDATPGTRMRWASERGNAAEVIRLDSELSDARKEFYASEAAGNLLATGNETAARERLNGREDRLKAALVTQPTNAGIWMELAVTQLVLGQREAALASGRKAVELQPEATEAIDGARAAAAMATIYAWTGDTERALAEFGRLLGTGGTNVHELRHAPLPAALRNDPRFEALLDDPKNNAPLF